jgi:hypothetical protein
MFVAGAFRADYPKLPDLDNASGGKEAMSFYNPYAVGVRVFCFSR